MTHTELQLGDRVKYHTGNEKWMNGIVHAVRKVDDINGQPRVLAYLIDTGRDERVDVYKTNLKDVAHSREFTKHFHKVSKSETLEEAGLQAMVKANAATEHLPDEIITDVVRQPQQVDVSAEWVKPR